MPIYVQEVTVPVDYPINESGLDKLQGTAGSIPLSPVPPSIATLPKFVTLSDVAQAAQTALTQSEQALKVKLETMNAPISVVDMIKAQYQQHIDADAFIKSQEVLIAYTSSFSSAIKAINDQLIPSNVEDKPMKTGDEVLANLWKVSQDYAGMPVTELGMLPDLITGTPNGVDSYGMPIFSSGAKNSLSVPAGSSSISAYTPAQAPESAF